MSEADNDIASLRDIMHSINKETWPIVNDPDDVQEFEIDELIDYAQMHVRVELASQRNAEFAEMIADLRGDSLTSTVRPTTRERISHEVLTDAVLCANDIVEFDRHRFCWSEPGGRSGRWNFRVGFLTGSRFEKDASRWQPLLDRVDDDGASSFQQGFEGQTACIVPVVLSGQAKGCLVLVRPKRFNQFEMTQLDRVARLLGSAILEPGDRSSTLLHRLARMFLHQRRKLQTTSSKEILDEYLRKIGFVCHPEIFDPLAEPAMAQTVRITAKHLSPGLTSLRITAALSASSRDPNAIKQLTEREWDGPENRRATVYPLALKLDTDGRQTFDSIAEEVYWTGQPVLPEDYRTRENARILFSDSSNHMSVPAKIIHDPVQRLLRWLQQRVNCFCVFSVETTRPHIYTEETLTAFALLGAHAAVPLSRAFAREATDKLLRDVATVDQCRMTLYQAADWDGIQKTLVDALEKLSFRKGTISQINQETGMPEPCHSWSSETDGGSSFFALRLCSPCEFSSRLINFHLEAIRSGCPQIQYPNRRDAEPTVGEPQSYGVFPFVDLHGYTRWTVYLEKSDGETFDAENDQGERTHRNRFTIGTDDGPFNTTDKKLVDRLCYSAMRAWERIHYTRIEREWDTILLMRSFDTFRELLVRFADFLISRDVIVRCRIFLITNNDQVFIYQAGKVLAESSEIGKSLGPDSEDYLTKLREGLRPILYVHKKPAGNGLTEFSSSGTLVRPESDLINLTVADIAGEEVLVKEVDFIPREKEYRKEGLSQWLEIPIIVREVRAKIVLDHKIVANPVIGADECSIDKEERFSDRFTAAELRLFSNLSRDLCIAADGLKDLDAETLDNGDSWENELRRKIVEAIRNFVHQRQDSKDLDVREVSEQITVFSLLRHKSPQPATIADDLDLVEDLSKEFIGDLQLKVVREGAGAKSLSQKNPICAILLPLLGFVRYAAGEHPRASVIIDPVREGVIRLTCRGVSMPTNASLLIQTESPPAQLDDGTSFLLTALLLAAAFKWALVSVNAESQGVGEMDRSDDIIFEVTKPNEVKSTGALEGVA